MEPPTATSCYIWLHALQIRILHIEPSSTCRVKAWVEFKKRQKCCRAARLNKIKHMQSTCNSCPSVVQVPWQDLVCLTQAKAMRRHKVHAMCTTSLASAVGLWAAKDVGALLGVQSSRLDAAWSGVVESEAREYDCRRAAKDIMQDSSCQQGDSFTWHSHCLSRVQPTANVWKSCHHWLLLALLNESRAATGFAGILLRTQSSYVQLWKLLC